MLEVKQCITCEAQIRVIWPPSARQPSLDPLVQQGWLKLLRCPTCGSNWMAVPHEPYAAFVYLSLWKYSTDDWSPLYALDEGLTLTQWADGQVKAAWNSMSERDHADIEHHRKRSFGRNPIDQQTHDPVPDIERLVAVRRNNARRA
jgi:hypothetical protein